MCNPSLDDLLVEAMDSEIKAKEFYESASEKAQSQAGKKLFKELAEFEQNHYNRVKKIIESRSQGCKLSFEHDSNISKARSEVEGEVEPNKDEIVNVLTLAIDRIARPP